MGVVAVARVLEQLRIAELRKRRARFDERRVEQHGFDRDRRSGQLLLDRELHGAEAMACGRYEVASHTIGVTTLTTIVRPTMTVDTRPLRCSPITRPVATEHEHQQDEWRRGEPVEDGGVVERAYRVERAEVDQQAGEHRRAEHDVEALRLSERS